MRRIKIGDKVSYTTWSNETCTASITQIEICAKGSKNGRKVRNCNIDAHSNGVVILNNRHWIYFNQITNIIPNDYEN